MQQKKALGADFSQRAITGIVGATLILVSIIIGRPLYDIGVGMVCMVCGYELYHMVRPDNREALIITLLTILTFYLATISNILLPIPLMAAFFLIFGVTEVQRIQGDKRAFFVRNYLLLLIGMLYVAIPLGLLVQIRLGIKTYDGLAWTLMLFANNWTTDAFALIGGRIVGRRKLAPKISPGKTVEGAVIGLAAGFAAGMAVAQIAGLPLPLAFVCNVVIALAVECGDLIESWVKRQLSVKDSGSILPGHGGFLDRADGTIMAASMLFVILALF